MLSLSYIYINVGFSDPVLFLFSLSPVARGFTSGGRTRDNSPLSCLLLLMQANNEFCFLKKIVSVEDFFMPN